MTTSDRHREKYRGEKLYREMYIYFANSSTSLAVKERHTQKIIIEEKRRKGEKINKMRKLQIKKMCKKQKQ